MNIRSWKVLILSLFSLSTFAQQESPKYSYDDLKPNASFGRVEQFVTQFLNNYHYQSFHINDSLSNKIFDNFLNEIDGGHSYFTQEDIDSFEKDRFILDEALFSGDLTAPYEIFNVYRKKYRDRYDFVMNYLDQPYDFNTDKTYQVERKNLKWAKDESELDEEWRKILLSQSLNLKLTGISDSAISATLKKRYERYENRLAKWRSEDVFQSFMNAFTEVIDPHTNYMIPSTAEQFNIDMSQSLEGIGASLRNEGDYVMIVDIIPGGPLFKSQQASKEEYIVAVAQGDDGEYQEIIGWLTDDAVKLIRGKKGSVVKLKLLPSDAPMGTEPREIRLVREKIKLEEAVASSSIVDFKSDKKSYKIGVIDIPMFYRDFEYARKGGDFQSTTKDVKRFLEEFKGQNVDGVVVDLRNNGGGSLTEAISLTGLFIPQGPVVQRRSGKGKVDVEDDTDNSVSWDGPLLLLQNRFSASASEIFAGAIQDYKRGLIVGEQSFGKGTVQQLVDLDQFLMSPRVASRDKGANTAVGFDQKEKFGQLKLTTEKFYRITGNSTQRKGVIPDIAFPSPFDSEEMGESSRPSALSYDEIGGTNFKSSDRINDKVLSKLKARYEGRLKSDENLKELITELEEYSELRKKKEYSLNYDIRLKEKEESENQRNAMKKLNKSKDESSRENDLYLDEAKKVISDLISIQK